MTKSELALRASPCNKITQSLAYAGVAKRPNERNKNSLNNMCSEMWPHAKTWGPFSLCRVALYPWRDPFQHKATRADPTDHQQYQPAKQRDQRDETQHDGAQESRDKDL